MESTFGKRRVFRRIFLPSMPQPPAMCNVSWLPKLKQGRRHVFPSIEGGGIVFYPSKKFFPWLPPRAHSKCKATWLRSSGIPSPPPLPQIKVFFTNRGRRVKNTRTFSPTILRDGKYSSKSAKLPTDAKLIFRVSPSETGKWRDFLLWERRVFRVKKVNSCWHSQKSGISQNFTVPLSSSSWNALFCIYLKMPLNGQ